MKEITRFSTITYETNDKFIVEIETDRVEQVYNAYLRHLDYGDKMFMFGMPIGQQRYGEFLDIVECNLDDYIPDYIERYMDEEHPA